MLANETLADPGKNVDNLGSADVAGALGLLTTAQGTLPPDDPSYQVISDFAAFLSNPTNFP